MSGICAVCGGARGEHFSPNGASLTVHAYTEVPGNLTGAPINQGKKKEKTAEEIAVNRLVEVLADNGILNPREVLYIATGTKRGVNHGKTNGS